MTGGTAVAAAGAALGLEAPHGPAWLFLGVGAAMVLGPLVASRARLPGIIGLLAGGLAIGPEGLGIVTATDTTVPALGQLGLLYLMFSAGLELDLELFSRYRRAAVLFGLTTFALPLLLGVLAGRLLDYSPEASLLLGSIWASHTLVTYPVVRSAGLAGNRAVATTVGATVLTDTLALVVLAGVSGAETGDESTVGVVLSLLLGLGVLAAYSALVLPRVTRWFFTGPAHDRPMRYSFLLAAFLSAAVLAEVVGIEGIVGAFFAGLGLNRLVPAGSVLMDRVEFFGAAILVPVFLVSVGILINPSVMVEARTLGLAGAFCLVVVGGKALAALAGRFVLGFSSGEAGLMFGLTASQAAATLAATFVGFDIGLFGERVVNAVLVVILVSLVVAAVVTERFAKRVEPTPLDATAVGRCVVVPILREDRLDALARLAQWVAEPDGGVVTPLRVGRPTRDGVERDRASMATAERIFAAVGLDAEARLRLAQDASQAIVSTLVEEDATLVVLDWQPASRYQPVLRGGRDDQFLGSSPVPVLLAAMGDVEVGRVVLALEPHCLEVAAEADVALAVTVARRLQGPDRHLVLSAPEAVARTLRGDDGPLPSHLDGSVGELLASMSPDGDRDGDAGGRPGLRPGDLVVMTAHPDWEVFGPTVVRASGRPGVSVVVVADPARWSDPGSGERGLGVLVGRSAGSVRWR